MPSAFKRPAEYVPNLSRRSLDKLSKASLMEIVYDYALQFTGGDESTEARAYGDIVQRANAVASVTGRKVAIPATLGAVAAKRLAEIDGAVNRGLTPRDPAAHEQYRRELMRVRDGR